MNAWSSVSSWILRRAAPSRLRAAPAFHHRSRATTALLGVALLLAVLVVSPIAAPVLSLAPAHAARTPYLRVMPLGDSITMGAGSTTGGGYRGPLWDLALQRHLFAIDYVGSQVSNGVVDPQHEGHSGWRTDQLRGSIDAWLTGYQPDVILLHIGINDLNQGHPVEETLTRLNDLIGRIFTDRPSVTVIYGGLIPATAGLQSKVATFNAGAQQVIAAQARQGHRVRYIDMPVTAAEMKDSLHPNDAGHLTMARSFEAALERVVLDQPPTSSTPPAGHAPEISSKVRWADFDGDGRDDYIVIADNGRVFVWLNRGGGWTALGQVATGAINDRSRVRFADFDGDRKTDYLWFSTTGAVNVSLNRGGDGHGSWTGLGQVATGATSDHSRVRFADFDGDRKTDYLWFSTTGAVNVSLNRGGDGHGSWTGLGQVATGATSDHSRVRLADFDGDRKTDYLWLGATGGVTVSLNKGGNGRGGWSHLGQVFAGATRTAGQVRFALINPDARADYVVVQPDAAVYSWVNGTGGISATGTRIAGGIIME